MIGLAGKIWKAVPPSVRTFVMRRLEPTFTSSAAGIIVNERGEVLLLNHILRPASGWGIPGGFIEKGEQHADALIRELREETGLEITNVELHRVGTVNRHIEVVFLGRATGEPRVLTREITEARWFAVEDIPKEMNLRQQFMIRKALGGDE